MRRAAALAGALLVALPCAAEVVHGSGRAATEERRVSGYSRITSSAPARIELLQDGSEGLGVTGDDNLLPRLETFVAAGELFIRFPTGTSATPATPMRITVHARSIEWIGLTGTAILEAPRLKADRLRAYLAGSARILLPGIEAHEVLLHATGHCHGMLAGRVDALDLALLGAGKGEFNAARLEVRRAHVEIAGSAQAALWVRDELNASVSGPGAALYYGDPAVEKAVKSDGRVERLGAAPP